MHMTPFEHQMLNLRGLAYSYGVEIKFDSLNRVLIYKWGWQQELKPEQYKDQMIFEETIKGFLKNMPGWVLDPRPERRKDDDSCINPERFDLP